MAGLTFSFFFILISSYFITSVFTPKEGKFTNCGFLILLGTMFAQIVFSFEVLSLFKAINAQNVLITNFIVFCLSTIFWIKQGMPLYFPNIIKALKKIWNALKRDKYLMIMAFGLLFFIAVSIILCIAMPVKSYDAMAYHLNRVAFWLSQGSLNHFEISDVRNLIMPINSELLYLWVLVFLKNDIGLGFFSFFGYVACAYSLYNILGYFNFSERRKLWSVFIMSSFASVIVEASGSETDILIAGLILSSIYLFLVSLKEKKISVIFFSALFYALAIGTKSPAIIAFPAVLGLMSYFSYRNNKDAWTKPVIAFCSLLFLNFIFFASYNYVLNFIHYGDFLGNESAKIIHGFKGGIKGFVANFIRYIFMLFDFSGFRYSEYVGDTISNARADIFNFLHIPEGLGVEINDNNEINNSLIDAKMGTGLFGFLLFLPSAITAIILKLWKSFCKKNSEKISAMFAFALVFFINIFCLSFSIAYFVFSIRFVTTMVVISSPVLALSYTKKNHLLKIMILFFAMSYFLVMSTNIVARNIFVVKQTYQKESSIYAAREKLRCTTLNIDKSKNSYCYMRDFLLENMPKGAHIGLLTRHNSRLYTLKMLEYKGYKLDVILAEKIDNYDLNKFDYILRTDYDSVNLSYKEKTKDILPTIKYNEKGEEYTPPSSENVCYHYNHNTEGSIKQSDKNPMIYAIVCIISEDYLKRKGFDKLQVYKFNSDIGQEKNVMVLYKNRKSKLNYALVKQPKN